VSTQDFDDTHQRHERRSCTAYLQVKATQVIRFGNEALKETEGLLEHIQQELETRSNELDWVRPLPLPIDRSSSMGDVSME